MNRGRTQNDGGRYSHPRGRGRGRPSSRSDGSSRGRYQGPAGPDGPPHVSSGDRGSHLAWRPSPRVPVDTISKQFDCTSTTKSPYQQTCNIPGTKDDMSSDLGKLKLVEISQEAVTPETEQVYCMSVCDFAPASAFEKGFPSISAQFDLRANDLNIGKTQKGKILDAEVESGSSLSFSPALDNAHMVNEQTPHKREVDVSVSASAFEKDLSSISSQPDLRAKDHDVGKTQKWKIPEAEVERGSYLHFSPAIDKHMVNEQTPHKKAVDNGCSNISDSVSAGVPYDICPVRARDVVMLKAPLHVKNRTKRHEAKRSAEGKNIDVLGSGMILLKSYISLKDQVEIVNKCRDLGLSSGGFYEPGYRGAKLHLRMMCLGKNWDPETNMYGDQRPSDGARPPLIPPEFCQLVKQAIQASHSFLREQRKVPIAEHVLPSVSPNICIVNFYSKNGRLGLHQDKDESRESLKKGLPVVSFSIGDSAEFLYNDNRNIETAEKIILESGDVLIFGGKSRHIFHGVTTIIPETAPVALLDETHLLPGRLNLTFREY